MPEYKARGTVTVTGGDGSEISIQFIASRVASYAELGVKVGECVQAKVEELASGGFAGRLKAADARIAELEKEIASRPTPALVVQQPPPTAPADEKPKKKAKHSDGI